MHALMERAGEASFPPDVQRALCKEATDDMVDIKPNGAIFVSHQFYRTALDEAFGVGGWALIRLEPPRIKNGRAIWYGYLKARGQFIEEAYGGCDFIPGNSTMHEDDAVEGAKSDCLVRCCKALPLFRNCWDKDYADYWKATYAQEVAMPRTKSGKGWKKKGEAARNFDVRPGRAEQGEYYRAPRVVDEQNAHIDAIANEGKLRITSRDEYNDNEPGYNEWEEQ